MENKINEREVAVYALIDITLDGGYNNIVLRKTLNKNNSMTIVQKAFVTEIVNGVLRNLICIDYIIDQFSNTKTAKMKPLILNVLRTGVYQMKYMDKVPHSAVCNEAVKLTKKANFNTLAGFVNAVLRSISRNIDNINYPNFTKDPMKYLSIVYSYPEWIVKKLIGDLDINYNEMKELFKNTNKPPKITIMTNTLKTNKNLLIETLKNENVNVTDLNKNNILYISGTSDISKLKAYKAGLFHIIDESATIAVEAIGLKEGDTLIDVCSAPGGKSFYSAYIMKNKGKIMSYDIHEHKIELIKNSVDRLGIKIIHAELNDATVLNKNLLCKADKVLVDVPCSGLGIVRKKPDIKYTKKLEDIEKLALLQRQILSISSQYVKDKGILLYSTCTLTKDENINNVKWFLENHSFELESLEDTLSYNINGKDKGFITILPTDFDSDGFFIARFRKKLSKTK